MEELFTPEETAAKLKVTMRTVKRWLQSGQLQGVKAGRRWRVRAEVLSQSCFFESLGVCKSLNFQEPIFGFYP